jgi:hypothetical protein
VRFRQFGGGQPAVIDDGGPLLLPAPAAPGPLPDRLKPRALALGG